MKFRKKPVVIDAIQLTWSSWNEVCKFIPKPYFDTGCYVGEDGKETQNTNGRIGLYINTLEGRMLAVENDWIIKGDYPFTPRKS